MTPKLEAIPANNDPVNVTHHQQDFDPSKCSFTPSTPSARTKTVETDGSMDYRPLELDTAHECRRGGVVGHLRRSPRIELDQAKNGISRTGSTARPARRRHSRFATTPNRGCFRKSALYRTRPVATGHFRPASSATAMSQPEHRTLPCCEQPRTSPVVQSAPSVLSDFLGPHGETNRKPPASQLPVPVRLPPVRSARPR